MPCLGLGNSLIHQSWRPAGIVSQLRALGFDSILIADYGSQKEDDSPAQIGDPVAYVGDQGIDGNDHAEALQTYLRPALVSATSGRKGWDLLDDVLTYEDTTFDTGAHTFLIVAKSTNTLDKDLIGSGSTGEGDVLIMTFNGRLRGHYWSQGGLLTSADSAVAIANDQWFIATQKASNGSFKLRLDGTQQASFAQTSATGIQKQLRIGSRGETGNGNSAVILAVLRAPVELSDSSASEAERLLADYYGLYHPGAKWITRYGASEQAAIHAAELYKDQADAMGSNPDMVSWVTRAGSNGGRFTGTTSLLANKTLLQSISGFRSKVKRLNTFCGNFAAALIPIIADAGYSFELSNNFVSGDYSEATGLQGDGATKYLDTGLVPSSWLSPNNTHIAVYNRSAGASESGFGVIDGSKRLLMHAPWTDGHFYSYAYDSVSGFLDGGIITRPPGFVISSRPSVGEHAVYRGGVQLAVSTDAPTNGLPTSGNIAVSAILVDGFPQYFHSYMYGAYSIGEGLTAAEVATYSAAMEAFQDALGRGVA